MKKNIFYFVLLSCFISCKGDTKETGSVQADKKALMEADMAFSAMSQAKGMKAAFIEFIDSNGVLLRPKRIPLVGANAIDYLIEQDDSNYILTWSPHFADASASGDLGYTYGVYELKIRAKDSTLYGSYVSIWKKQKDGKWKFVLDTGNEGVDIE